MAVRMQQRRATAEQWLLADPVLAEGEIGLETDTYSFKIGDGVNNWSLLDYFESGASLQATIDDYIPLTQKGAPLGVAELDANGFVPAAQLDVDLTGYATETYVNTAVSNLVDAAPDALNTLNELAAALNDDANAYVTLTAAIDAKPDNIGDLGDVTITSAAQNQVIKFNGTAWVNAAAGGGILASDTAPTDTDAYPLWYNTTEGRAYIYYDSFWVELTPSIAGPAGPAGPDGTSGLVASDTAPTDTDVIWLDTDEVGTAALSEAALETYLNGNMATNMIPDTNSAYDLGTAEYKWRDLYLSSATIYLGDAKISSDGSKVIMSDLETGDIHLNNESRGGNSVDGTWGSYRIEEGQDDLFLINQRTSKKYKFNLTEVDPNGSA